MSIIQKIAVALALIAAALTSITVNSALNSATSGSSAAQGAIDKFTLQTIGDTTVYQQQVSALWANKDLLKVVADQSADANKIAAGQLQVSIATNWLLAALVGVVATMALGKKAPVAPQATIEVADAKPVRRKKTGDDSEESTGPKFD